MADELSRFVLVDAPALPPANDPITGTVTGPFIDTGYDIPFAFRGRLYISVDNLREMARVAGIFEEERQVGEVMFAAAEYTRGYTDCLKENLSGELRDIHDRLGLVAGWIASVDNVAVGESPEGDEHAPAGDVDVSAEADGFSEGSDAESLEPAGQVPSSARRRRPASVPSDPSDAESFRV